MTLLHDTILQVAAEETGRVCFGVDLDPLYVDVAVRRWQARTRRDAVHAETAELFNDRATRLAAQRTEAGDGAVFAADGH